MSATMFRDYCKEALATLNNSKKVYKESCNVLALNKRNIKCLKDMANLVVDIMNVQAKLVLKALQVTYLTTTKLLPYKEMLEAFIIDILDSESIDSNIFNITYNLQTMNEKLEAEYNNGNDSSLDVMTLYTRIIVDACEKVVNALDNVETGIEQLEGSQFTLEMVRKNHDLLIADYINSKCMLETIA